MCADIFVQPVNLPVGPPNALSRSSYRTLSASAFCFRPVVWCIQHVVLHSRLTQLNMQIRHAAAAHTHNKRFLKCLAPTIPFSIYEWKSSQTRRVRTRRNRFRHKINENLIYRPQEIHFCSRQRPARSKNQKTKSKTESILLESENTKSCCACAAAWAANVRSYSTALVQTIDTRCRCLHGTHRTHTDRTHW